MKKLLIFLLLLPSLKSGQYYFSFYYKGKIKAYNYSGSLIISK